MLPAVLSLLCLPILILGALDGGFFCLLVSMATGVLYPVSWEGILLNTMADTVLV